MKILCSVLLLCVSVCVCYGESEPIFDAKLVPSIADKDLDFWFYSPPECGPEIPNVKKIYQDQVFMLLMFSRVHPANSQTKIDITYDLKITADNNTISLQETNSPFYKGDLLDSLILPKNVLDIGFDKKEKFGKHHIEVVFRENVSKRSYTATAELELVPFEKPKTFASKEEYGEWLMNYFKRPDPVRAFAGILYDVKNEPNWIEENYMSLAFYRRVFTDNPFLWEYYTQLYKTVPEADKKKMLLAAGVITSKEKEKLFVPLIEPSLLPVYQKAAKIHIPDTDKELTTGTQLDILWAEFFARGKYESIKRIVIALSLQKYSGTLDKIKSKEIKEMNDDVERRAMLEAVYQSAMWSLKSNSIQFDLVHQYCQTIYENETLSPEVKKSLAMILKAVELKKQKSK